MALLEVVLAGTYYNQQTINRWNYVSGGVPAAVSLTFALASAFGAVFDEVAIPPGYPTGTILDSLKNLCSDQWDWQQLTVINVYNPVDFYQTPFVTPYGGSRAGQPLSPIDSYGFRTNQVRRDVSRGTKRFPGMVEDFVENGGNLAAIAIPYLEEIAERMTETLEYDDEGNTLTFSPAVVKKQKYNPATGLADPDGTAYRYIPAGAGAEAAQLAQTAVSVTWQHYTNVRSQVSRQYGHGR